MNQITTRISQLETQQRDLEAKVNTGELIVPVNALMTPFFLGSRKARRSINALTQIERFYHESVDYINQNLGATRRLETVTCRRRISTRR